MFTLEQLNEIHDHLGTQEGFPEYVRAPKTSGVEKYDSYLTDGHSEFFGKDGYKVVSPPVHDVLLMAIVKKLKNTLSFITRESYLDMSRGLANSGVEKWIVDTSAMTFAWYDKHGTALLMEKVDGNELLE